MIRKCTNSTSVLDYQLQEMAEFQQNYCADIKGLCPHRLMNMPTPDCSLCMPRVLANLEDEREQIEKYLNLPVNDCISAGVDTYEIKTSLGCSIEQFSEIIPELVTERSKVNQTTKQGEVFDRLVIKPENELVPLLDAYKHIMSVQQKIGSPARLTRLDISCDFNVMLENHRKTFRLIMEAIAYVRNLKGCFKTLKEDDTLGCMKIHEAYFDAIVYACHDKPRLANTRLECRKRYRNKATDFSEVICEITSKHQEIIADAKESLSIIEEVNKDDIIELYNNTETPSMASFVDGNKNAIFTESALKALHKKTGKGNYTNWINSYKSKRSDDLAFTSVEKCADYLDYFYNEINEQLNELRRYMIK